MSEHHHDEELGLSRPHAAKKHDDGEGIWLLSYSDMMTLLMGFFALMLSMSDPNPKKAAEVAEHASQYFGGKFQKPLAELKNELEKVIKEQKLDTQIRLTDEGNGVGIIIKGLLLFDSGSTQLRKEGDELFNKIIPIIKKNAQGYFILVEGHTDNAPISNQHIPSNWELSGFRASTVTRKFETFEFKKENMMTIGWGETRPIKPNNEPNGSVNEANRSENRRVVIKVLKDKIMN